VGDLGGIEISGERSGWFLAGAELAEPGLFQDPILVPGIFPAREVHGVELLAFRAEARDNVRVSGTVFDHEIDFVAEGFGKPSDFPVVAPGREFRRCSWLGVVRLRGNDRVQRLGLSVRRGLRLGFGRRGGFVFRVHKGV